MSFNFKNLKERMMGILISPTYDLHILSLPISVIVLYSPPKKFVHSSLNEYTLHC